ncbi:hypothetical protein [Aquipseudomonas campi]
MTAPRGINLRIGKSNAQHPLGTLVKMPDRKAAHHISSPAAGEFVHTDGLFIKANHAGQGGST